MWRDDAILLKTQAAVLHELPRPRRGGQTSVPRISRSAPGRAPEGHRGDRIVHGYDDVDFDLVSAGASCC